MAFRTSEALLLSGPELPAGPDLLIKSGVVPLGRARRAASDTQTSGYRKIVTVRVESSRTSPYDCTVPEIPAQADLLSNKVTVVFAAAEWHGSLAVDRTVVLRLLGPVTESVAARLLPTYLPKFPGPLSCHIPRPRGGLGICRVCRKPGLVTMICFLEFLLCVPDPAMITVPLAGSYPPAFRLG
eukprot:767560-Hanusia_phi.AAC.1